MATRFMLDTDICILFRSGKSHLVAERMTKLTPGEATMSVVTYGELRVGAEKSLRRASQLRVLEEISRLIQVRDLTPSVGAEYGAIRADLERRGQIIGSNDLWIAAHARSAKLTLVTNNEDEFRRVPGLSVENWAHPA